MPKYIPEIRVSPSGYSRRERMENDSYSECAMSDVATDCETLEANYSKRTKVLQGNIENRDEDVTLTDVDASSDDERETVIRYPLDYINSILALGMSCEEISNTEGPNKRQKSITCSLERSKARSLNADKFDEGGTDVEGVFMSEDEDAYRIDSDSEVQDFEPTAYVSISDKVVTGTIASPRVTPEPCTGRKKRTSNLTAPIPISSMLTDTEMLISDTESNSTRSRKTTKVKPFKNIFGGFASESDDSDSSTERSATANSRPNRKINCSRSFDTIRNSLSTKSSMLAPIRKIEDGPLTDTEQIYLDDAVSKMVNKSFVTRPTVIRLNKPIQSSENLSAVRYRYNAVKSKSQPSQQVSIYSSKKCNEKIQKQPGCGLNVAVKDDTGNATDVEAFGSDSDDQTVTIKPVAYLPDPKRELIIDNESYKGKMAFILPITDSQKGQSLRVDDLDCGYSDVEDLPGFEADEYFRYPTPELPRTEHSMVQNKEAVIDPSKLTVALATKEPLTDTEELDISQKQSGNRLKVKLNHQRKNKDINECHTDIEDLDGSDTEDKKVAHGEATDYIDQVELTDVGELSSDDSDDEGIFRFSAATPDLDINNTYTTARESMTPFSFDVRRRLNDSIPKIRTISPSPIPRNTSNEDFLAPQEESANSNWISDDSQIEAHSSQLHVKHTRKFNIDEAEKLHIKGYANNPDPTTDVEELTILEALEELRQKKRKLQQKRKEQSEGASNKLCYSGHKGPSNKPNPRISKSSGRHDKPRGADKSKEAVNSSWLSQRESGFGRMGINAGGGLKSPYDNINSVYYREMADETVYPPHLGYAEFESHDVLGSNSSLAQEHGTDTFSELLFSSSNSECEEPDENFPISKEYETYGILYDMSSHISKVPEVFVKRTQAQARPDSPQDLESRLKYYHNLCNRSLSPEVHGVSPAERAELKELEESISQMLIDIRREERNFYSDNFEGATNTVKRRPKPKKDIQNVNYKKLNEDGETALKEIESHISKLLQDVEKEEREVMGSLRRDFRDSSENLEESVPSPWDMINATTTNEGNPDVSYVRFRESSCTPSPVESSSTSEDEYDVVPRVELNIGSRMGRSTIDISVKNSPTPKTRSTRMNASKKSLNRSLPSLKSSSLNLVWKDHNSSESIFGSPTLWQSSSVEYISPPQRIQPGSGYCIWSYPNEDEYGQDQVTEDAKKTPTQDKTLKEPLDQGSKDKGKRNVKKESAKKNENPSLFRKESFKRLTPDKTPEPSKKVLPDKTAEPSNKLSPDITPEPSKRVSKDKKLQPSKKASPDKTSDPSKKVSPDKTTELSKKVSTDKAPDLYKKISPDKASAPSKRTSPDKKLEPPKKVSPEKSTEPLKKESPDKTPEPSKKVPPVKADKKLFERGDSKKSSSPEKSILASQENVAVAKAKSSAESSSVSTEKVMSKSHSKSAEKEGGIEVDSSKTISTETTKKESTKSETTVKENVKTKEDLTKVEEKITEQAAKPAKGAGNEKKSTILGKTIETIKKPFQDKSAVKEEKGNAKGKGKRNSADSIKTPSLEIGEDGEDRSKSELDSKGQVTKGSTKEIISVTSQVIQEPVVGKTVVEKSVEIVRQVSGERGGQSGKGKGKGKGKGSELLKALSKTKSEEQGKSIIDLKGEKAKTDSVTNEDEGMPKEHKGKGKGKEKPESPKGDSLDKGDAKGKTAPTSTQADKSSESKNEDEGVDQNDQGKLQSADRVSVVEPLIEKTIQDSRVISVGSVTEDKVKKDDTGSPTSDKNKGKGKDKGKERQRSAGTPSLAESDKPQKSDTNVVGKAVEIIKKPFQSQAKPSEDTKAAQKPGKGKKQKSIESQKIPSFDKDDGANEQVELASLSERDENDEQETLHPENDDTKVEKPLLKDNKTNGKGKGKQKSTESTKTLSFDKDKAVQNEPKLETVLKEQNEESKNSEQTKRESKKKSKGNQQSTDVPNTQSLEEEDGTLKQVSTQETTLIDGTLENIKRPFRGQKDEKSESKEGQEVEGKKGKGKAKQKSTELVRQSSTEEHKEGRIRTTETVRLIKELSEDKNGQVIEERAIDLVTKPFGDKPPLLKSTLSTEESTRPAILIKELSQDKSGQEIEDKAIELVSKPLEQRDSNKVLSGGLVTTTTITLSNEKSQKQCGQIMEELQDLACQPLQEVSSSQKQAVIASENSVELVNETLEQRDGKLPAGKIVTATVISLTRNVSPVATGFAEKELDIVSRPLQDMLDPHTFLRKIVEAETPITGPPIQELSHEKSKFIIEERPIDLVSQPFQGILESVHQPSLTRQLHDGGHIVEKSTGEGESSATGPLIKELSHEKSGFIIEERPIDLVSQPFQDILESVHQPSLTRQLHDGGHVVEKSTGEGESSVTGPLIKELSHEKSGFIIEERPIDLVSQPFQGILETLKSTKLHPSDEEGTKSAVIVLEERYDDIGRSFEETRELPPSSVEGTTRAVSLMKELSQDQSGQVIQEGAIDLVAQPFLGSMGRKDDGSKMKKKESKLKTGDSKKKDGSTTRTDDFEHIQKTIDDARIQFEQFVGIVSEKATKSSSDKTDESESSSKITKTSQIMKPGVIEGGEIHPTEEQEVEIPVDKEEDLLRFQNTIQCSFQDIPTGKIITTDEKTAKTTKKIIQGAENVQSQAEDVFDADDRDMEKFRETVWHAFQDIPSGKIETAEVKTVTKTITEPVEQGTEYVSSQAGKAVSTIDKDIKEATEMVQHGFQDTPSGEVGSIDIKTVTTTVAKPSEQGVGNVHSQAEKIRGVIDKDLSSSKICTTDIKTLTITIAEPIEPGIEIARSQADKVIGVIDKDTKKVSIHHGFQDTPSGKIGTDMKTVTTTISKPTEQGAENGCGQAGKVVGAVDEDIKEVTNTVQHEFQDIPCEEYGTINVETVSTTITVPTEQEAKNVQIQMEKVIGAVDKDTKKFVESVQHEFQDILSSEKTGTIGLKTVTSISKPVEQGAEKFVGAVDKDIKKVAERVSKSLDGGVTVIEKSIESQVKSVKDIPVTCIEKSCGSVREHLPKLDDSFLSFGKKKAKETDLSRVEEIVHQQQNLPSEKGGTINVTTLTETVTKPIEQRVENLSVRAEKVAGDIEEVVRENMKRNVDGEDTTILETNESRAKTMKDAPETFMKKSGLTVTEALDGGFKGLGEMAHETMETFGLSQSSPKIDTKDMEQNDESLGQEVYGKDIFPPELRAQSVKIATFETVETIPPPGTEKDGTTVLIGSSCNDEIGRIIKEMESQLLSTKFGLDEYTVEDGSEIESEDYTRESRTMPTTPLPARKVFSDTEAILDSEGDSKPYVTTPTLSRRVIGVGGSQRLTQDERPVVRVITEYVGDLSENEPEEDTYTVLEPEVRERRKFKIRFSPDMYGSENKEDDGVVPGSYYDETAHATIEDLKRSDSIKSEKNNKRIERKFERMTSQTKEADPSMSEVTDGEFQRMVSQLSLEEMDQALHQWDVGGLTPSEIDSKDLTLSSDDTTSPLQQGLTDIFRPKLSSILPTSIYVEKTGTEVGASGVTESSKMKLSLVKDSVPQIFQSVETDGQVREGSHTLEPGETGETPPIPSPRTPLKPTDSDDKPQDQTQILDKYEDESKNYATRKMFWEQISTGSVETPPAVQEVTPPVPKPRIRSSLSQSIDLQEEKKAISHSEASIDQEVSEIGESENVLHGVTSTASVARDLTSERGLSLDTDANSEMEFIKSHDIEELSYDNDAFDDDTPKDFPFPEPKQRKGIYERSVSLPGDTTIDISNNVRSKKKIFEAQIKKEMVVEQLMSQMEEEGSPEHKAFAMTSEPTDQAAMLNRQIHSEIVSHELEEQIESNLLENKALVQNKVETNISSETEQTAAPGVVSPEKTKDDALESDKTNNTSSELPSIYETKISTTVAEVLHYKNDAISKPSDSLEVHVDKSELEDTEKVKDIEDELRVIDEKYDSNQLVSSEQVKVSSITSSQGESEDTFSESDVTPEEVRFKEQQDIQVWGPSDKEIKLTVDKLDEQKKTRSVHTPEEHIPDTVWEVPVQESTETLEVETVGHLPTAVPSWQESEALTESEARKIAELFVGEIESELINKETLVSGSLSSEKDSSMIKTLEKTTTKKSDNMLKLIRTDTTTSSMEITDEDLRSSGMTDNSPLESQAAIGSLMGGQRDVFEEDSGDDVDAQELDRDTIGKDVVEKTLAEVKQSLEAVKEELIEEKKKKRDSITKESPSEFEFKALVLEKTFTESIQEHHQEEATIESWSTIKITDGQFPSRTEKSEVSKFEESYSSFEQLSKFESETKTGMVKKLISEGTASVMEPINQTYEISEKEEIKFEENKTSTVESTTLSRPSNTETHNGQSTEPKEIKTPGSTTGSEVSIKSAKSQDTVIEKDSTEKQESAVLLRETEKVTVLEDVKDEVTSQIVTLTGITDTSSRPDLDLVGDLPAETEERKSPLDDVFSNSSSSDYKGGSNDASILDKPNIIIRKHKKSTLGAKDPKSDGELYSSSGSHYESFEQTSESIKSPGSRPLSSDMEGLVAATAGMTTGSSEYESAVSHEISGQSTTITSREYQTAVSSLSSRDSMKSLDSESSGNLASIEVSSEASETLVPSAMELEKDSEEPVMKHQKMPSFSIDNQVKMQSFSESIEQSVSFDISGEDNISEDDYENQVLPDQEQAIRMKRSHEMTFQPEPRPIVLEGELGQGQDEKLASSLDDMSSLVSTATDTGANRTVIELSKTESERMDGSATSEQLSLTVSGTSDLMSLSESREVDETTVLSKTETTATQSPPFQQLAGEVESVTITTSSIMEQGIQSVCTQVTSKVEMQEASHSNGPTQVEYNAEYDEGDHEVKRRGHRRNESTSFRPSMIPVLQTRDTKKKSEDIIEDSAESDKYTQSLTEKEGTHEEKKDVDETEKLEEEFYKTEADQAMNRDLREGRISIGDACYGEGAKSFDSSLGTKSRLHSVAFSDDHPDSEIAELLKQCSSDIPSEDPIERPKTPEPVEECELKDDTPEFSSEAQASVTELEMEYSGAFSRSAEYAAHVSPIREKRLPAHESWEHLSEGELTMDDPMLHSPDPLNLRSEDSASEKHELETHESTSKEKTFDRSTYISSPVPDITVTQHMHPTPQDSFEKIEIGSSDVSVPSKSAKVDETVSSERGGASKGTEDKKDDDSASDSPTSDSFELLEKPDLADEFVIIEEVGREASEHDTEGKSVKIDTKRVNSRIGSSSAPTIVSPPTTVTKMTQVKYFSSGATEEEIPFDFDSGSPAKSAKSEKESSQEGSPPSAEEPDFKPDLEASKKWMEMQFQGAEPIAQIYGYDVEYDRGPLEDIKEEDINDLEGSSRIGSMGSQVSQSIGSFGSVKESLSSTPDYDVLAGRKFFTRSGEHDDVSMSSLQEFERLEHLIAMESSKHKSLGSQDSLTSSSNNSRKHGSRSGGDDISLASLKEFEGLESACIAAERIEKKAKAEEESLLSEIEEGHESQASESESCATISVGGMQRGESDEDDYERRMFEIDEIIRQAQTNVEQFMDSKNRETVEGGLKSETLGRADSLEEISKVPELDLDQPLYSVSYSSGKSYIQQWEDLGDDLITSTDSLELKTQKSKTSVVDPFTTSTDSLDVKMSQDVMSVSTDSIEASQRVKKKDLMTDSIEVGEKTSMLTSIDSLDGKVTQADSIDEDEHHAMGTYDQSSSSGKEGDLSSSGKDDSAEGAVGMNRMPPPRAEYLLGSTDSLEPTSSTATHATYQYETDSVMSSSFTSGDSTTMVDDNDEEGAARASMWFDEGKPYVTEVIEPIIGDEDFSHVIHRKVEMPPEIHKVSFKGMEAEHALREYIEKFDPGEDCTETREVDKHGNVHVKRIIQKRVIVRPEELGGDTTDLSGHDLEKYLQTLTQSQAETEPLIDTIHSSSESHSILTTSLRTTTTLSQGESIKTEQEQKQTVETHRRGSRPPLKYDISVDEEPEFDPREHDWRFNLHTHIERDEETQEGAYGFSENKTKGAKK